LTSIGVKHWRKDRFNNWLLVLSALIVLLTGLLTTFKTQFIWEAISWMSYVQFPWRYLAIIGSLICLMAGASVRWIDQERQGQQILLAMVICAGLMLSYQQYFKPMKYLDDNDSLYYTDEETIKNHMSGIIPDFLPSFGEVILEEPTEQRFEMSGQANQLKVNIDRTHEYHTTVEVNEPGWFTANILYFPGWKMYVNGIEVEPVIDKQTGLMKYWMDRSKEKTKNVSGKFTETPLRAASNAISVVAIMVTTWLVTKKYALKEEN